MKNQTETDIDIVGTDSPMSNGSADDQGGHHLLDDELVDMLENDVPAEDSILTEYMTPSGGDGDERTGTIASWLPDDDENKDETFISPQQAKMLSVGRAYHRLFGIDMSREVAVMREIFDDFEKYLVSMHGMGREEQVQVLSSLYGSGGQTEGSDPNEARISLISNEGDE